MPEPSSIPWYRQFWPWFLILLPASAVAASFTTLVIALRHSDSVVRPDWSDHGYRINEDLGRQSTAARRGISARIELSDQGRALTATLTGMQATPANLELRLQHPTHAERDIAFELVAAGANRYTAVAPRPVDGTWDATLRVPDGDWQIRRRIWLTQMQPALLEPLRP